MAVRPIILCGSCQSPVLPSDKFCTQCGSEIEWLGRRGEEESVPEDIPGSPRIIVCPSCGVSNDSSNTVCSGCGSPLTSAKASSLSKKKSGATKGTKKPESTSRIESWKIFAGVVAIAVVVVLVVVEMRNSPKEIATDAGTQANAPSVSPTLLSDIETFEQEADAHPTDAEAQIRLANALHDAKFLPRAIEAYKKYLRLKPNDPDALVDMGICFYESGDSPTAIDDMKTALQYDPTHQMALYNLGIVTLNMGDLKTSNDWFKKSIAANPNTDIAKRAAQLVAQHTVSQ